MKKFFKWLIDKNKQIIKWLFAQLKDWRNFVIFAIVFLVVSCEVWVPYLLGVITNDAYWFGIGSACWLFWLGPGTPFLPLCIGLTLGIRKIIDKIRSKNNAKQKETVEPVDKDS